MRAIRLSLGCIWVAGLLLAGAWLWQWSVGAGSASSVLAPSARGLAVFAVAAALFIFMVWVADDLCPRASPAWTNSLKFLAAVVALGALVWAAFRVGLFNR